MYSSVLLAGSGYLINDYLNQRSDRINRPNQPISALFKRPFLFWSIYALMNASALFFGHQLDLITQTPKYIWIFFVITTFLGAYSGFKWMKFIMGPLIISSLVALVPLLILELVSDIQSDFIDQYKFRSLQPWIWRISFLAFWVNALREIVKDIQDINGDKNDRCLTIPIVVGLKRTTKLLVVIGLILIVILGVMVALAKSLNLMLSLNLLACLLLALGLTNHPLMQQTINHRHNYAPLLGPRVHGGRSQEIQVSHGYPKPAPAGDCTKCRRSPVLVLET